MPQDALGLRCLGNSQMGAVCQAVRKVLPVSTFGSQLQLPSCHISSGSCSSSWIGPNGPNGTSRDSEFLKGAFENFDGAIAQKHWCYISLSNCKTQTKECGQLSDKPSQNSPKMGGINPPKLGFTTLVSNMCLSKGWGFESVGACKNTIIAFASLRKSKQHILLSKVHLA